jgi:hypothetical protein
MRWSCGAEDPLLKSKQACVPPISLSGRRLRGCAVRLKIFSVSHAFHSSHRKCLHSHNISFVSLRRVRMKEKEAESNQIQGVVRLHSVADIYLSLSVQDMRNTNSERSHCSKHHLPSYDIPR